MMFEYNGMSDTTPPIATYRGQITSPHDQHEGGTTAARGANHEFQRGSAMTIVSCGDNNW